MIVARDAEQVTGKIRGDVRVFPSQHLQKANKSTVMWDSIDTSGLKRLFYNLQSLSLSDQQKINN